MTKKQLKEAYTNWNREITKLGEKEKFSKSCRKCAQRKATGTAGVALKSW